MNPHFRPTTTIMNLILILPALVSHFCCGNPNLRSTHDYTWILSVAGFMQSLARTSHQPPHPFSTRGGFTRNHDLRRNHNQHHSSTLPVKVPTVPNDHAYTHIMHPLPPNHQRGVDIELSTRSNTSVVRTPLIPTSSTRPQLYF
ncbi:hypothetical protein P691DRAFT_804048 [Macrolepiota fuliginosa MF-IS2]|uniref:Secreted protein n=1 Tax=Macrolepiota fuliginosa MF-IS2 TaxID=1400762 RepID=A0A9P5XNL6_9AGAR|nr:hypothetical protein P691DRAFT_804048 [Macrolepiota fuliginosa MF-IS2]